MNDQRIPVPERERLPCLGKVGGVYQLDSRGDFEAASASDDDQAVHPGLPSRRTR